jgi:hypothetical protein
VCWRAPHNLEGARRVGGRTGCAGRAPRRRRPGRSHVSRARMRRGDRSARGWRGRRSWRNSWRPFRAAPGRDGDQPPSFRTARAILPMCWLLSIRACASRPAPEGIAGRAPA